jgi:hypothetical protein
MVKTCIPPLGRSACQASIGRPAHCNLIKAGMSARQGLLPAPQGLLPGLATAFARICRAIQLAIR